MFILTKEQLWPDFSSLLILRTGLWIFGFKKTNPFWRKNISSVGFVIFPPYFWSEIQTTAYGDSLASLPSGQSCEIRAGPLLFFLLVIKMYAACVLRHTCSAILILHLSHQWSLNMLKSWRDAMDFNGRISPQSLSPYFCKSKNLSVIPVLGNGGWYPNSLECYWLLVWFRFPSVNSVFCQPRENLDLAPIKTLSYASDD